MARGRGQRPRRRCSIGKWCTTRYWINGKKCPRADVGGTTEVLLVVPTCSGSSRAAPFAVKAPEPQSAKRHDTTAPSTTTSYTTTVEPCSEVAPYGSQRYGPVWGGRGGSRRPRKRTARSANPLASSPLFSSIQTAKEGMGELHGWTIPVLVGVSQRSRTDAQPEGARYTIRTTQNHRLPSVL